MHKASCTEGSSANAYIVDGAGRLVTRPSGPAILGGVTRAVLLELARADGLEVVERAFTLEEAQDAREAFLTSTSSLVLPVTADRRPADRRRHAGPGRPPPARPSTARMWACSFPFQRDRAASIWRLLEGGSGGYPRHMCVAGNELPGCDPTCLSLGTGGHGLEGSVKPTPPRTRKEYLDAGGKAAEPAGRVPQSCS